MKILSLCFFLNIALVNLVFAQKMYPDSNYYKQTSTIEYKSISTEPLRCLNIYKALFPKYKISVLDIGWFWQTSIKCSDSAGFYESSKLAILNTGMSLSNYSNNHKSDSLFKEDPKLRNSYNNIMRDEPELIRQAVETLNWTWIVKLNYLYGFDQGIRYTERGDFKNKDSFYHSMIIIDSTNLDAFASFVKLNGFPKIYELGCEWGKIQGLLHHLKAITICGVPDKCRDGENTDKCRADYMSIMPGFYQTTVEGQGSPSFYRYIYESLINVFTKAGYTKELEFLKKYELK